MGHKSEDEIAQHRLGAAIRQLRAERKLTRRELERATGLSYPYLSEIEAGKKSPSTRTLRAIADALGLEAHDLLETAETGDPRSWTASGRSHFHGSPAAFGVTSSSPVRKAADFEPHTLSPLARDRATGSPPSVGSVENLFSEDRSIALGDLGSDLERDDQLRRLAQVVKDLSPEDLEVLIQLATRLRK